MCPIISSLGALFNQRFLSNQNAYLEAEVQLRMRENDLTEAASIRALVHLAETRDPETGNHILRTQEYVKLLASRLNELPGSTVSLTEQQIELLSRSAALRDRQSGHTRSCTAEPGPLSHDEWVIMRTHTVLGAEAIELEERDVNQPLPFLGLAKEICRWHHERSDG